MHGTSIADSVRLEHPPQAADPGVAPSNTMGSVGYLYKVFRATEEANRNAILAALPKGQGGALLDLGTHQGEFAERVAERLGARRRVGVEMLEEHAAVARGRGFEMFSADLDDGLPFADGEFDVVHANQVVEHVHRTDRFLSEIRRVLAPGGMVCISTNNLASWHNLFSLALGYQPMPMHVSDEVIIGNPLNPQDQWAHADVGRSHLRLFTVRALVDLCAYHGLHARDVRTVGYYPLPPVLARLAVRLDKRHGAFTVGVFEAGEKPPAIDRPRADL